jgi:putative FmdB family regulatory protein
LPRYDYRCTNCAEEFELVQTFAEAGKGTCPMCSGAGQRVFHAVPVIYKGSGFYTTDYGRPKPPAENKNGSSEGSSSSGSSSDSDSKSETPAKSTSDSSTKSSDSSTKSSTDSGSTSSTPSTPASST